jgi:hypothetical protein
MIFKPARHLKFVFFISSNCAPGKPSDLSLKNECGGFSKLDLCSLRPPPLDHANHFLKPTLLTGLRVAALRTQSESIILF